MSKNVNGLYLCPVCDSYYGYGDDFDSKLLAGCKEKNVYTAVIKCQCGALHVAGGEWCSGYGEDGIMMFGRSFKEEDNDRELEVFDAVMLTACDADDPECVASTYVSFGYILNPDSTGRSISLKPGKPTYIFRNLPINCTNNDSSRIRWCVAGSFDKQHGVLEWCTSYEDACGILQKMQSKTDEPDKIQVCNYGIDEKYVDTYGENKLYTHPARPNRECDPEDVALIKYDNGYAVVHIVNVMEDRDQKRYYTIWLWYQYSNGNVNYLYSYAEDTITADDIVDIISRSNMTPQPLNYFRSGIRGKGFTRPLFRELAQLTFYVPNRLFRDDVYAMFHKQYPNRQDGSFNKKLFKRWLRQNIFKILAKKK